MSAGDRKEILDEAGEYITKDRNSSYGEPEDNFSAIAGVWNAQGVTVSGRPVEPYDVALMMLGMKIARLKHNPTHKDSWVDAIGYAACGWDVAKSVHRVHIAPEVGPACGNINDHIAHDDASLLKRKDAYHCTGVNSDELIAELPQSDWRRQNAAPEVEPVLPYSQDVGINASGSNVLDMIDAVNHKLEAEHEAGWVSQNRCGKSGKSHPGHRYYGGGLTESVNDIGPSPLALWCDGWRTPAQRDIEAVKRVADKQAIQREGQA